jgi:hypothetical protein
MFRQLLHQSIHTLSNPPIPEAAEVEFFFLPLSAGHRVACRIEGSRTKQQRGRSLLCHPANECISLNRRN